MHQLGTLFPIDEIVTTNWDTYFEELCFATPIVEPHDYAYWNLPGRKVFKIHGSTNNVGSLVATEQDYAECYERLRTGLVGASLKHMLATKVLVFLVHLPRPQVNRVRLSGGASAPGRRPRFTIRLGG